MVAFCSGSPSRPWYEGNSHFLLLGLEHSYVKMWWLELLQVSSVYEQKSLRAKADRLRISVGDKEWVLDDHTELLNKLNLPLPTYPVCDLVGFWPVHIPTDRAPLVVTGMIPSAGGCGSTGAKELIYIHRSIWSGTARKMFSPLENSSIFNAYLSWNKSLILWPTFP